MSRHNLRRKDGRFRKRPDPDTAKWLSAPALVSWMQEVGIDLEELVRFDDSAARRLYAWRTKGGVVAYRSVDRVLIKTNFSLNQIPVEVWLAEYRDGK